MSERHVLVTGGAGFIGASLAWIHDHERLVAGALAGA
jgi:nucleoside-diphosphate-sugar epimerase